MRDSPRTTRCGRWALAWILGLAVLAAACNGELGQAGDVTSTTEVLDDGAVEEALPPVAAYANSGWPTLHGDSANRRYVPIAPGETYGRAWSQLAGSAVLSAPTIGPEGHVYLTTGRAEGGTNLHAFDLAGTPLWSSAAWRAPGDEDVEAEDRVEEGVDHCAVLESPVVDTNGDVYVGDCDQMWAFHADGEVKWVADLPPAPARSLFQDDRLVPFNPAATALIHPSGVLVAITVFGQVVALEREDGAPAAVPYELPAPATEPVDSTFPDDFHAGTDLDPELFEPIWQMIRGGVFPAPNTPAQTDEGTILAVATSDVSDEGMLYAVKFEPGTEEESGRIFPFWSQSVGPGAMSSPSLSLDRATVYVTDAAGDTHAVDAETGGIVWTAPGAIASGSLAVGPDDQIYGMGPGGGLIAFDAEGDEVWATDLADAVASTFPSIQGLGAALAGAVSAPTVTDDGIVVAVDAHYVQRDDGSDAPLPVGVLLVLLDPSDGTLDRVLGRLTGRAGGNVTLSVINGSALVSHGCRSTPTPTLTDVSRWWLTVADLGLMDPRCGLEALRGS